MTVVKLITVGEMKKLLDQYDDDLGLDFGDYEFKRLKHKTGMLVDVELTPISDYELGFGEIDPDD